MRDFTSSLYLGMQHPSSALPGWRTLTTGRPAVMGGPPGLDAAAAGLAALAGAERARLARSSLHALGDCLEVLTGPRTGLVVDAGIYPVGWWAVQRACGAGVPVQRVRHHDVDTAIAAVERLRRRGLRPVLVANGVCTGCGRSYPLVPVEAAVRAADGTVLLDDTQALGVLGARPDARPPYGTGGGGSVRHSGVAHDRVVSVSSLAKGFGVPVACIAASAVVVAAARTAGSAVHSSPPSAVDVAAAQHALSRNATAGDALRGLLAQRVTALRAGAAAHGLFLVGGLFPVQSTPPIGAEPARRLLRTLAAGGVHAVLQRSCLGSGTVTLVVTARHRAADVERAADLLGSGWSALAGPVRRAL